MSKRLLKKDKKGIGALNILLTAGIMITIVVIALAIGSEVLDDLRTSQTTDGVAFNVSTNGLSGLGNMSGQVGLIGTVIALTVVLLILVTLLFKNFARGI